MSYGTAGFASPTALSSVRPRSSPADVLSPMDSPTGDAVSVTFRLKQQIFALKETIRTMKHQHALQLQEVREDGERVRESLQVWTRVVAASRTLMAAVAQVVDSMLSSPVPSSGLPLIVHVSMSRLHRELTRLS